MTLTHHYQRSISMSNNCELAVSFTLRLDNVDDVKNVLAEILTDLQENKTPKQSGDVSWFMDKVVINNGYRTSFVLTGGVQISELNRCMRTLENLCTAAFLLPLRKLKARAEAGGQTTFKPFDTTALIVVVDTTTNRCASWTMTQQALRVPCKPIVSSYATLDHGDARALAAVPWTKWKGNGTALFEEMQSFLTSSHRATRH